MLAPEESTEMMLLGYLMENQLPRPNPPTPLWWLWDEPEWIWGQSSETELKGRWGAGGDLSA